MLAKLNEYAKAVIAGIGFLLIVVTTVQPLLGDQSPSWLPAAVSAATAVLVFLKKNVPADA